MKLAILLPDLDLPWKQPKEVTAKIVKALQKPDIKEVRRYWREFAERAAEAFRGRGHVVEVVVRPSWEFTPDFVNRLAVDAAFVPHKTAAQFPEVNKPIFFYMQVHCRWLFTVDSQGWSAAASGYPCDGYVAGDANSRVFNLYAARLVHANQSKFQQPPRRSRLSLLMRRDIPLGRYIFFPCQIPHDESISLFSPYSEAEVLRALVDWSNFRGIHLVLKEHPINRRSMAPLKEIGVGLYVRWSEANIHDLIRFSRAVYTINSGVGFEAMFHNKPVVTFGRVEYDCVTIPARPDGLDAAWTQALATKGGERLTRYCQFIDWFCRHYAIDLSDEANLLERLDRLVDQVLAECEPASVTGKQGRQDTVTSLRSGRSVVAQHG